MYAGNYTRKNLSEFFKNKKLPHVTLDPSMYEAVIQYATSHAIDSTRSKKDDGYMERCYDYIGNLGDMVEKLKEKYPSISFENINMSSIDYLGTDKTTDGDVLHIIKYYIFDMDSYCNFMIYSYIPEENSDNMTVQEYIKDVIKPKMLDPDTTLNLASFTAKEFEDIVTKDYDIEQCTGQPVGEYLDGAITIIGELYNELKTLKELQQKEGDQ